MNLKVVDLGTNLGNAIGEFLKRGKQHFTDLEEIRPEECLGVDKQGRFQSDLIQRGYNFSEADLTTIDLSALPEADYYLAWDFLEYLPDTDWSAAVLQVMLHKSRRGLWLKMPSFEATGLSSEKTLKDLDLRFAWTTWPCNTSHFTLLKMAEAISAYKQESGRELADVMVQASKKVLASGDPWVVPASAPIDTHKYSPTLGLKPSVKFNPPLVAQWDVIVKFG